ncbi:restriction endonuclease [Butyrivibrio sp. NC2002]|uniref:restriction endonuclease n=1 Tax=Butyrivibrio sp. NC2002 TaxID=1410610 RepID=UPI00056CA7B7|nr:restriction endonuclease [Butyrivibrio sp. NC2002]
MDKQYLMVRAMTSQEIHFREFFDNSVVAVGWSQINFTDYSDRELLKEAVKEEYYFDKSGPHVAMNLNECARFSGILAGDLIIVPYYSGIALAIAESEALFSEKAAEIDLGNQHKVSYLYKDGDILSVPRNNLSEGLQRRLRVPGMSVSDLSEFSDEIEKLFSHPDSYSYSNEAKEKEDALQKQFKKDLLKNIQNGKTNLQTGGIGMENLVKELFECEGYYARVMAKTSFKGSADADVEAWRDDAFASIRIFAQVKHHSGTTGNEGIRQIVKVIESKVIAGENCKGMLITSAKISEEDARIAEDNNIDVVDGDRLVEIIYSNLGRLSKGTLDKLGVVMVPSVLG